MVGCVVVWWCVVVVVVVGVVVRGGGGRTQYDAVRVCIVREHLPLHLVTSGSLHGHAHPHGRRVLHQLVCRRGTRVASRREPSRAEVTGRWEVGRGGGRVGGAGAGVEGGASGGGGEEGAETNTTSFLDRTEWVLSLAWR